MRPRPKMEPPPPLPSASVELPAAGAREAFGEGRWARQLCGSALLFACLSLHGSRAAPSPSARVEPAFPRTAPGKPLELPAQVLSLPEDSGRPLFIDVDGDGLSDLLVLDLGAKQLLNYHQRPEGFPNSPDQVLPLPPQTAWVAACDVDAHPGLELLMSTATGLVYSRQDAGLFESQRRPLVEANQVFTNAVAPVLISSLGTNPAGTNRSVPLIFSQEAVPYRRDEAYHWTREPPLPLKLTHTEWGLSDDPWLAPWTVGTHPARSLHLSQAFRARPDPREAQEPETDAIRKLLDALKKTPAAGPPEVARLDVDGDGREDTLVWQCSGKTPLDLKTDMYVFLRGADQKLPERPTQSLHARGFPIPLGSTSRWSPVGDLRGDGSHEVILLEFNTRFASASGLLEAALSHGLSWLLTVRSFRHGFFAASPEASVPIKMVLPAQALTGWTLFIEGDFNGDGRPELVVQRSDTQWDIFFSTTDGTWFAPQPAFTVTIPPRGYLEVKDLNGDGRADLICQEPEQPRLTIFMSPRPPRPASTPSSK